STLSPYTTLFRSQNMNSLMPLLSDAKPCWNAHRQLLFSLSLSLSLSISLSLYLSLTHTHHSLSLTLLNGILVFIRLLEVHHNITCSLLDTHRHVGNLSLNAYTQSPC